MITLVLGLCEKTISGASVSRLHSARWNDKRSGCTCAHWRKLAQPAGLIRLISAILPIRKWVINFNIHRVKWLYFKL